MRLLCLLALICAPRSPTPGASQAYREKEYRVEHYDAELAPDVFLPNRLSGQELVGMALLSETIFASWSRILERIG